MPSVRSADSTSLRLAGSDDLTWDSQGHFFAAAAEAMRRILIEKTRSRRRVKRGGGHKRVKMSDECRAIDPPSDDLIALDEALQRLESAVDERKQSRT